MNIKAAIILMVTVFAMSACSSSRSGDSMSDSTAVDSVGMDTDTMGTDTTTMPSDTTTTNPM